MPYIGYICVYVLCTIVVSFVWLCNDCGAEYPPFQHMLSRERACFTLLLIWEPRSMTLVTVHCSTAAPFHYDHVVVCVSILS